MKMHKVWIVSKHMVEKAGIDDTLKVFSSKEKAEKYAQELEKSCDPDVYFVEFEERDLVWHFLRNLNISDTSKTKTKDYDEDHDDKDDDD